MTFKELKLKEDMENFGDYKIKKHLSIDEIGAIVNSVLKEDNSKDREIIKGILLVYFATDIEVEKDKNGAIVLNSENYDLYNTNGILNNIELTLDTRDYSLIEKLINYEESVNKTIKDFCIATNKSIENVNLNKIIGELQAIGNNNK